MNNLLLILIYYYSVGDVESAVRLTNAYVTKCSNSANLVKGDEIVSRLLSTIIVNYNDIEDQAYGLARELVTIMSPFRSSRGLASYQKIFAPGSTPLIDLSVKDHLTSISEVEFWNIINFIKSMRANGNKN